MQKKADSAPRVDAHKAELNKAYSAAVRFLGLREHNEYELREKLESKGFDEIIVDDAIERLKHYDYLSEARYAESFLRSRLKKGEAPWLAARKARQKGADPTVLQVALEEAESNFDAWQTCKDVLDKRDPTGLRKHDKRIWQRQLRYLQGKGFDMNTILQVMNDED
ncbi:MAG: regulatory protein RecX [Ghiorsea sp.]